MILERYRFTYCIYIHTC